MKHKTYIARKRARFKAGCGENVNIPYGTALTVQGGFLVWKNKLMCADTSQIAYDYFSHNDDGPGQRAWGTGFRYPVAVGEEPPTSLIPPTKNAGTGFGKIPSVRGSKDRNMKITGFEL